MNTLHSDFEVSSPENEGLSSKYLLDLLKEMNRPFSPYHGIIIIKNGKKILEATRQPYERHHMHAQFSITKSWLSALIGIAQNDGLLNINEHVVDFFQDYPLPYLNSHSKELTVLHLLTMTAGYDHDPIPTLKKKGFQDWALAFLDTPPEYVPGKKFLYSSACSQMLMECLSHRIEQRTTLNIWQYIDEKLFFPLNISVNDYYWKKTATNTPLAASGLYLSMENMVKIGYLYLCNGAWKGHQIIPKSWVQDSLHVHVVSANGPVNFPGKILGYGYHWWQNPYGGFSARGVTGQNVHILPQENMVIAFTAGIKKYSSEDDSRLIDQYILPALQESRHTPSSIDKLYEYAETMEKPQVAFPSNDPSILPFIGCWNFETNKYDFESITLVLRETTLWLAVRGKQKGFYCPVGTNGRYIVTDFKYRARQSSKTGLLAYFSDTGSLIIEIHALSEPFCDFIYLTLSEGEILLEYLDWSEKDLSAPIHGQRAIKNQKA